MYENLPVYLTLNKHKLKYGGKDCPFINRHQAAFPYKVKCTRLVLIIIEEVDNEYSKLPSWN